MRLCDPAHQRTFGTIPVAAGAEYDDQAAKDMRPDGLERGFKRVGSMRIIHEYRRAVLFSDGKLHASADCIHPIQIAEYGFRIFARSDQKRRGSQGVHALKSACQIQFGCEDLAPP